MDLEVHKGNIVYVKDVETKGLGDNIQDSERPYAIISNWRNNKHSPTVNMAPLSTNVYKILPQHVFLGGDKIYGLGRPSIILIEQTITVNKSKISAIVGTLDAEDMIKLNNSIRIQFDV